MTTYPDIWFDWKPAPDPIDRDGLLCIASSDVDLSRWGIDAVLPAGFRSDGMSIPRFFWRIVGPKISARTVCPAVVHDWLYVSHIMTRRKADRWLACALWTNGCNFLVCSAVYLGVRIGGALHW